MDEDGPERPLTRRLGPYRLAAAAARLKVAKLDAVRCFDGPVTELSREGNQAGDSRCYVLRCSRDVRSYLTSPRPPITSDMRNATSTGHNISASKFHDTSHLWKNTLCQLPGVVINITPTEADYTRVSGS